jgi:hypothetical protein
MRRARRPGSGEGVDARTWHPAKDLEWTALIKARSILQAVVWAEESPKALAPLVEEASCRPTATDTGLAWELHAENTGQAAVRAVLAWDTLRISSPGRLRPCANTDWRKFLIDHTPAHPRTSASVDLRPKKPPRHPGTGQPDARVFTGAM